MMGKAGCVPSCRLAEVGTDPEVGSQMVSPTG